MVTNGGAEAGPTPNLYYLWDKKQSKAPTFTFDYNSMPIRNRYVLM